MLKSNCNFYLNAYFLHLNFQTKIVIPGKGIGVWFGYFVSKYTHDIFVSRFKENVPHCTYTQRRKRTVAWHWRRYDLIQNKATLYGKLNCHLTTVWQFGQSSCCLLFIWVDLLKSVLHTDLIVPSSKTLVTHLQIFHWKGLHKWNTMMLLNNLKKKQPNPTKQTKPNRTKRNVKAEETFLFFSLEQRGFHWILLLKFSVIMEFASSSVLFRKNAHHKVCKGHYEDIYQLYILQSYYDLFFKCGCKTS